MTALAHEDNRYLTAEEVAERFSVSTDSIHRWRRKGHFPVPIIFGLRTSRWSLIDLMEYEAKQHANTKGPPGSAR